MSKHLLLLLGLSLLSAQAQTPLDVRIALVIGNAAYTHAPALDNAANDAKSVAQALRDLGFTVEELLNANKAQMTAALNKVRDGLKGKQGLGMLYYAGHGMQLASDNGAHNFLIPVDVSLTNAATLAAQTLEVGVVINAFKLAHTRMNILVLDACRDNPLGEKAASASKGLASQDAPPGTLLAYATQPGNVAEDGETGSANGPYAEYLTTELHRPFAKVEDVFKRVRWQVRRKTEGRQIPWESTSLEEDFVFNDGSKIAVKSADLERFATEAQQRQQALILQATQAREREQQLALVLEKERVTRAAVATTRAEAQRQTEATQAKEAERQRGLQLALAQAKEQELRHAKEQAQQQAQMLAQIAAEKAERERLQTLSKPQQREQVFAAEKAEWDRIRDTTAPGEVFAYLIKYPSGNVSELAQAKLEQLDKPKIQPVADAFGVVQAFQARRFQRGDRYQFVVKDLLTKAESDRPTFVVTRVDNDTAEFNNGYQVTQSGAIIRTIGGATLDPYQQWTPSGDYQVGKKWQTRSVMTLPGLRPFWVEMQGRVVARETITVPAGTFDTFKMEMEQTAQDGARLKVTYWAQPDWGVAIKQIREVREGSNYSGQVYELASRKRGD